MKYAVYILMTALLFTSHSTIFAQDANKQKSQANMFRSVINGSWCEAAYIKDLEKTRSPLHSQKALNTIVQLVIDVSQEKNGKLEVDAQSIHEGGSFTINLNKKGIIPGSYSTDIVDYDHLKAGGYFYVIGFVIESIEPGHFDTSIIIYHYNKNKKLLDKVKYIKTPACDDGPFHYRVNQTLMAGNYTAVNSTGQVLVLNFTNDGLVTGLPGFKKYFIDADFGAGPESEKHDGICFDIQTANQKCYETVISGNAIKLYDNTKGKRGQLQYTLTKQ